MSLIAIHEDTLDETLAGPLPVLVEFSAGWCGPCHMLAATLASIASEQRDRLSVVTLDVDDNLTAARRFEVLSVPTLILFVDGQPALRLVGARGKAQLLRELAAATGWAG
jgi:thioredoxin